ncbi:hypothetical protein DOY81_013654, partial [Sarcophaga bullata]
ENLDRLNTNNNYLNNYNNFNNIFYSLSYITTSRQTIFVFDEALDGAVLPYVSLAPDEDE